MQKTVNVRIGDTNPPQKFDTTIELRAGDHVIVETANGAEWGVVDSAPREARGKTDNNMVLRVADANDMKTIDKMATSAKYALRVTNDRIEKYKLQMKPISAYYTFDASKVVIQYQADHRVDFRDLVKDLAYSLRARIELRQVGPRDEVKLVGAMGPCGMECCCARFLRGNDNPSIKMAKNQNIALNPQKINGMCGRLLCCLGYENDHYVDMAGKMPRYGSEVTTQDGRRGIAQDCNMISENVRVKFNNGDVHTFETHKRGCLKCKHLGCNRDD